MADPTTTNYEERITVAAIGVRCHNCNTKIGRGETAIVRGQDYHYADGRTVRAAGTKICVGCGAPPEIVPRTQTQPHPRRALHHTYGNGWCPACGDEGCYAERAGGYEINEGAQGGGM